MIANEIKQNKPERQQKRLLTLPLLSLNFAKFFISKTSSTLIKPSELRICYF